MWHQAILTTGEYNTNGLCVWANINRVLSHSEPQNPKHSKPQNADQPKSTNALDHRISITLRFTKTFIFHSKISKSWQDRRSNSFYNRILQCYYETNFVFYYVKWHAFNHRHCYQDYLWENWRPHGFETTLSLPLYRNCWWARVQWRWMKAKPKNSLQNVWIIMED